MKLRLIMLVLMTAFLAGCADKMVTSCPPFPSPAPAAVDKIQGLHDRDVDDWMVRLFKLKKQLEVTPDTLSK